jgi:hypothetical protein
MSGDAIEPKIERLIGMAERLITALEADIAALERGKPGEMRTIQPEIQTLSALYGREAQGLTPGLTKAAPDALRARLTESTRRFAETLSRHTRLVTRVKTASEGMIRAIAEEVDRRMAPTRTYGRGPAVQTRPAQAMIFNNVI